MIPLNSLRQHLVFMTDAFAVEAGASTDTVFEGDVAKETHPDARWGSISYTHLANAQHTTALSSTIVYEVRTNLNSAIELLLAHSWFIEEVLGASGNLAVED